MADPIKPGAFYTVVEKDSLWKIATRAYGNAAKWDKIWRANDTTIRSGDPNLIYPGEKLFIPIDEEKQSLLVAATAVNRFAQKGPLDFTLILDGREVVTTGATLDVSLDSVTDEWSADIDWVPGADMALDKLVRRYSYTRCQIALGDKLCLTGRLYNVNPAKTAAGITKKLNGNSLTADVVDSSVGGLNYVSDGTMAHVARTILSPMGIQPIFNSGNGLFINYFEWKPVDTAGQILTRLASQSAQLVNNDENGNIVFEVPDITAKPVGTLREGELYEARGITGGVTDWSGSFNGRALHGLYIALGQSGDATEVSDSVQSAGIPSVRRLLFIAQDLDSGGVTKASAWKRSKAFGDSMSVSLPVSHWYAPDGSLWWPGKIVVVDSPTLEFPNYRMLIKRVTFRDSTGGKSAVLIVVPPESLTGAPIKEGW